MKKNFFKILLSLLLVFSLLPIPNISLAASYNVVINEVESSAQAKGPDQVELYNKGSEPVDISRWYITDDKDTRLEENKTTPFPEGTVLNPKEFIVLTEGVEFDFGLGKNDEVKLYDNSKSLVDSFAWEGHAAGTYGRYPDGTGEFIDIDPSLGSSNVVTKEEIVVQINEINSAPDDWVEITMYGGDSIDISGYEIRDNSDDHRWRFKDETIINKDDFLVIDAKTDGLVYDQSENKFVPGTFESAIGIGSGDSIRLYDNKGNLIDSYSWTEHAAVDGDASKASLGRYDDRTGGFVLMPETKGRANEWYKPEVKINEIESNGDVNDWVEIINIGKTPVDISGWYIMDNDPVGHASDYTGLPKESVLNPGEFFVFEQNTHFSFGLGKEDSATLHIPGGAIVDSYPWTGHADGVYARIPDGTGEFVDFDTATKNAANIKKNPVVLNEIQSKDPNGGPDWIELANPTDEDLDISGLVIKDDDDKHSYIIPEGTVIEPNGFLVITEDEFGFGLGKSDMVRVFENDLLIQSTNWDGHTNPTWGLYPDEKGVEYRNTLEETKGSKNKFAGIPDVFDALETCPVKILDETKTFLEDSSGLDFRDGKLYAVDNGTGIFWIVEVKEDNSLNILTEKGVRFKKDSENPDAKGPDAEGIAVDSSGMVYIASERDNSDKGVNFNSVLMIDPRDSNRDLVALKEWDLTSLLPQVSANMGIEAIEWIPRDHIEGKVIDKNTGKPLDLNSYPNAIGGGIFTVALEDNGHVYGFVLNDDESSSLIFDIDSKLGGAMSLDYDEEERLLWVSADDGYGNMRAVMEFNGTDEPTIVHVIPPVDLPVKNLEGFAIGESDKDGNRKLFWFEDGVKEGALRVSCIKGEYREKLGFEKLDEDTKPVDPTPSEPENPKPEDEVPSLPNDEVPSVPDETKPSDDSEDKKVESFGDIYRNFKTSRISGKNRYETAVEISKKYFEKSETVIVASGEEFIDALTVSPLASKINAPILLSNKGSIPKITLGEIERLKASKILLVGGTSTLSMDVQLDLSNRGYNVTRISGINRYETAVKLGEELRKHTGNNSEVVLSSGENLVDSLSANNISGKQEIPILLTGKNELNAKTKEAIETWNVKKVIIIGGSSSVSESAKEEVENTGLEAIRLSGKDRYETAVKVSNYAYPNPTSVFLANGSNYIDALVGGAVTKRANTPLLLTKYDEAPSSLKEFLNNNKIENIIILGGTSSIK